MEREIVLICILFALVAALGTLSFHQAGQLEKLEAGIQARGMALSGQINETQQGVDSLNEKIEIVIDEVGRLGIRTQGDIEELRNLIGEVEKSSRSSLEQIRSDIENIDTDFSALAEDLYPSIVSITTERSRGSGFIITEDGFIVTNAHVIEDAETILVVTGDGTARNAWVSGSSSTYDIAVLKIPGNYKPLEFESRENIKPGQRVITIGNPLGLSFSLSQGVISALDREFEFSPVKYIQTDTPINPGNSGGPMINKDGNVVGIATGLIRGSQNLGFAIPVYQVEDLIASFT